MLTNKNKNNVASEGFTLIELMVATSLLMIVMFSGYYAYNLYSKKWQSRVHTFWDKTEDAVALDTLNKVTSAALPYIVKCNNNKSCVYFKGDNSSVSFVSNSPIYSSVPALVKLSIITNQFDGTSQLIYQEHSLTDHLILELNDQTQWQHEITLLKNISNFNFSYFGWVSFESAVKNTNNDTLIKKDGRVWYQEHLTNKSRLLPDKLRVSFTTSKGETNFQLALTQHSIYEMLIFMRVEA